jgi:putative transposase
VVIRHQGYRFLLKPTASEEALLRQFLGCSRFVWNAILAENEARYEQGDPLPLNSFAFSARLMILKRRHAFLRDAHSQPLQQTVRDLASAYQRAFDPSLGADLPIFKRKGEAESIRLPQAFKVQRSGVYLPKIGWVAFRASKRTRAIEGKVKSVTVRLESGRWYVAFLTEREIPEKTHPRPNAVVGIDVGVTRFAALSDGTFIDGPNAFKRHAKRLACLQRRLSRRVKRSANWRKAKARVTKLHFQMANIRRDHLHKSSAKISKSHAIVVLEDLRIKNMSASASGNIETPGKYVAQKRGLNRRILDQGWGEFRRQLKYKLEWSGGKLLLVDPRNTSRTCSACGDVSAENRTTQAAFKCVACGLALNADTNAARNILGRAGCARIACGDLPLGESAKQEAPCVA